MRKIKLLFLGVIIPLMPLCAQIDSIQQLKEVVVTDIKLRDDSKTISVLKLSDSLTQFSSSNLKSVLNDFANINTNENGPGGVSSVFLRGTNSNHTQVVWNGIPINSKFLGQSDLNLVNASNFDDISIRYGGGGIEYGSGAIGGTIHLNSNLDFKKSQQIKLQTSYGSFDTWSHQLKLKKSGAKFSSALSVNRTSSINDYSIEDIDYENVDGDFNNTAVEVNLGYLIDEKHSLKLFSSFFDSHRKFSDSEVGMVQNSYDNLNSRNLLQHLFTNKRYVSTTSLANLYDEYQFYTNFNNETPLNDTNSRTFVFKNESSFSFSSDLQLKLIAEHNIVDAQGDGVGAADYNNSSLSLLLNHQFNKLFYNFKLRQEVYDFDSLSFSKAFNKTKNEIFDFFGNNEVNNNPFLYAFGLHYNPIKKLNFYTNASSNFRIPTLNERFWIGSGNPDILPENSQQYDFSVQLKGKLSDLKVTEERTKDRLFHSHGVGYDSMLSIYDHVIKHLEAKRPFNDQLPKLLFRIHQMPGLIPKESGYQSLMSSGMDIIQTDSIRSQIGEYYTVGVPDVKVAYKELRDDLYNYILGFSRTLFVVKEEDDQIIQIPSDYEALLENREYIESIKMFEGIYRGMVGNTKNFLKETIILKHTIETYLNTKE